MDLHRASAKADWESIESGQRTRLQRLAAATHGYLTPANVLTVIGLCIVLNGLIALYDGSFWSAAILLVVGRLLDIADGLVAQATKTKSPLGELFDATADKVGTFLTIIVLFVANVTYWELIVALILPQLIISGLVLYKKQKGTKIHPTRPGKLSMAFAWVAIVGVIVVKALGGFMPLAMLMDALIALSFILGIYALWQYATGRDQG